MYIRFQSNIFKVEVVLFINENLLSMLALLFLQNLNFAPPLPLPLLF